MPLPLPDLDDRRWHDLVDEATSLIHRYAPGWTDYNVSDPGITLIDLLAWITEADVFGLDRVPRTHRERFLALAGSVLNPVKPASTPLEFAVAGPPITVPNGVVLAAVTDGGPQVGHQLSQTVQVLGCALSAVQVWTGDAFVDRTHDWRTATRFDALGPDPSVGAALLLGFDPGPGLDPAARLSMWLDLDEPGAPTDDTSPPAHHGSRTVWEVHDGSGWTAFGGGVVDDTRSLTRPGRVVLPFGEVGNAHSVQGAVNQPLRWARVRLAQGRPDVAPRIGDILINAGTVVQATPAFAAWQYADPAYAPPPSFVPGARISFAVRTDTRGKIVELAGSANPDDLHALILNRVPGSITWTLLRAGVCDGAPSFEATIAGAPVVGESVDVWTADLAGNTRWTVVDTLLRSGPGDDHVVVDPTTGVVRFGDGEHGRIPSAGSTVLVGADSTGGVVATPAARTAWRLDPTNPVTAALTASNPISAAALSIRAGRPTPAQPADELETAEGRAADAVWTHERLIELAPPGENATLDQLDRTAVLARSRPPRAAVDLDFERLALQVPGTAVLRAKAWAGLDPAWPCLAAPGTVTVVVVPGLPARRPTPTPGLLDQIQRYLHPRRTLGTRLAVTAPDYVEVSVRVVLAAQPRVDTDRARADAESKLYAFLNPLTGGPHGRGWPFGRNVFQSELLRQLDLINGVDHVEAIELSADGVASGCGDICVGPFALVVSGTHEVSIR